MNAAIFSWSFRLQAAVGPRAPPDLLLELPPSGGSGTARTAQSSPVASALRRKWDRECGFAFSVYCFRPDHLHLVVDGTGDDADCKKFIKAAKQFSGYYYRQACSRRLWQRYEHERGMRDDLERALTIRYVVANPVKAGLAKHPSEYAFLDSTRYTIDELLRAPDYSEAYLLE
jgi:REP element-mobilizing transposase RayT